MRRLAIELFAGCGGLTAGLKKAGFDVVSAVEINPIAAKTYALNHPDVHLHITDVSQIHSKDFQKDTDGKKTVIDLLAGCSPCQGFSRLRKGEDAIKDPRNQLVLQYLRLVQELHPKTIMMENVPGIIRSEQGEEIFRTVLDKLKKLGYVVSYDIVDAADYGVPQFRKRFVLLGTRLGEEEIGIPKPEYGDPDKIRDHEETKPWKTVKDTIYTLPELKNGEKNEQNPLHRCSKNGKKNLDRIQAIPHDGGSRNKLPEHLVLECHKRYPNGYKDVYGRMKWNRPAPTITSGCTNITRGRFIHPEQDRGISLLEAALFQTFDMNYQFYGNNEQIALQIGNAVPVKLGETMGRRIIEYLEKAEIT